MPRASRAAVITASVPEQVKRTLSMAPPMRATTAWASRSSTSLGAPNEVESATACSTAATTSGWAWPAIIGPQLHTRST